MISKKNTQRYNFIAAYDKPNFCFVNFQQLLVILPKTICVPKNTAVRTPKNKIKRLFELVSVYIL